MRGIKILFGTTALLTSLALAPAAQAQVVVDIGVQPNCAYGYYGYAPYRCAPRGYYGPGYFYNGVFLGMGPWSGWGYSHGWGSHRFIREGGGRYHGGPGRVSYRASSDQERGSGQKRGNAANSHGGGARPIAGRAAAQGTSHGSAPHASASHSSGGGGSRDGGNGHQGGGKDGRH